MGKVCKRYPPERWPQRRLRQRNSPLKFLILGETIYKNMETFSEMVIDWFKDIFSYVFYAIKTLIVLAAILGIIAMLFYQAYRFIFHWPF